MKAIIAVLFLSSASLVGVATLPKKELPAKPPQSVIVQSLQPFPRTVKLDNQAVEEAATFFAVAAQAGGTWYAIVGKTGSTVIVNTNGVMLGAGSYICGPFAQAQMAADWLNINQGGIWMGNGAGGHTMASTQLIAPWP